MQSCTKRFIYTPFTGNHMVTILRNWRSQVSNPWLPDSKTCPSYANSSTLLFCVRLRKCFAFSSANNLVWIVWHLTPRMLQDKHACGRDTKALSDPSIYTPPSATLFKKRTPQASCIICPLAPNQKNSYLCWYSYAVLNCGQEIVSDSK